MIQTILDHKLLAVAMAALVVFGGGVAAVPAALDNPVQQQQAGPTSPVVTQPGDASVDVGETTTFDVVVSNADGGVGAYNVTVGVADSSVASITDVELGGDPAFTDTFGSGDATTVRAAGADTADTGEVSILTVTVEGVENGTTDVTVDVNALGTEAGVNYAVPQATGATLTVGTGEEPAAPATYEVSNLSAPETVTKGDTIDVSADVTNTGDEAGSQAVEFRIDLNQDGTLSEDEALVSQTVDLDPGETQTVTFADLDTSPLPAGEFTHGVFTEDDSATAQITVEEPAPTADVTFENQTTDGTTVVVESVTVSDGGFVAIHNSSLLEGNVVGSVIGVSDYLAPGSYEDVEITLYDVPGASYNVDSLPANETLIAMPHLDTNGNETYDFVATGGEADGAYVEDGSPVIDTAQITVAQEPANFQVSNLDAPDEVDEGDAITVSADVTNTGETAGSQAVEFRLDLNQDGTLSEDEALVNQTVDLDPGETQTVTFADLDTSGLDGEYQHGVFSDDDNATATIEIDEDDEPAPEPEIGYYQIDFIGGEPYAELGPESGNDFYAEEDRLLRYAFGNTEDGVTELGNAFPNAEIRQCVDYQHISQDGDTASITFTVNESCEDVTLSLAVYEKDEPGFDRDMVQVLSDSDTGTFDGGTHTLTIELPDSDDSDE
jgi:hypothetical protein